MPADKAERLGRDIAAVLDEPAARGRARRLPGTGVGRRRLQRRGAGRLPQAVGAGCARPASRPRTRTGADMGAVQNVLFIMADQLRADHLGCYGHPYLETPSLTAGGRGARFTRAFVNSRVCGPSRMSYYTGRYPSRHGATWNRAAFGQRDHARRIPGGTRARSGAGRQDPRDPGQGGHGAACHRRRVRTGHPVEPGRLRRAGPLRRPP